MKASAGKRVLMLLENNPYRFDRRVRDEARTLTRAGYHVTVICPRPAGASWIEMDGDVRLYQFPLWTFGGAVGYVWEYTSSLVAFFILSLLVLAREGFDFVHTHNPPDVLFLVAGFYKLFGKRFIYDHHDLSAEMYRARFGKQANAFLYRVLVRLEQMSCHTADVVIATNESYRKVEMEQDAVPGDRITVVRNGPHLERLSPVAPDPQLRARASTILGYVGVLGPQDGLDYLLRAMSRLVHELNRTDVLAVVVGKGDMLDELKKLVGQLNIEKQVWFTGYIPDKDMIRYLSTADICLDPDPRNPFTDRSTMIKMMEYMALGKPIVAFDLTEHRVTAEGSALYARPNDELDFARQIATLMDDPVRAREMGARGRRRVENDLAWCYQEKNLLQAYSLVSAH